LNFDGELTMNRVSSLLWTGITCAIALPAAAAEIDTQAFEQLKPLVGVWQPADKPDSTLRVTFALTAGGTVLTENWQSPTHTSMTVYHLDGASLIATHYCPRGNQPRMALTRREDDGTLRFEFRDGTGLDEPGEHYEHLLTLRIDENGDLTRGEVYAEYGKPVGVLPEPELTRFSRTAPTKAPR
jgi:hypothetical protein